MNIFQKLFVMLWLILSALDAKAQGPAADGGRFGGPGHRDPNWFRSSLVRCEICTWNSRRCVSIDQNGREASSWTESCARGSGSEEAEIPAFSSPTVRCGVCTWRNRTCNSFGRSGEIQATWSESCIEGEESSEEVGHHGSTPSPGVGGSSSGESSIPSGGSRGPECVPTAAECEVCQPSGVQKCSYYSCEGSGLFGRKAVSYEAACTPDVKDRCTTCLPWGVQHCGRVWEGKTLVSAWKNSCDFNEPKADGVPFGDPECPLTRACSECMFPGERLCSYRDCNGQSRIERWNICLIGD